PAIRLDPARGHDRRRHGVLARGRPECRAFAESSALPSISQAEVMKRAVAGLGSILTCENARARFPRAGNTRFPSIATIAQWRGFARVRRMAPRLLPVLAR